jgi:hypothetical protein
VEGMITWNCSLKVYGTQTRLRFSLSITTAISNPINRHSKALVVGTSLFRNYCPSQQSGVHI